MDGGWTVAGRCGGDLARLVSVWNGKFVASGQTFVLLCAGVNFSCAFSGLNLDLRTYLDMYFLLVLFNFFKLDAMYPICLIGEELQLPMLWIALFFVQMRS